jgi:hypothetical protein
LPPSASMPIVRLFCHENGKIDLRFIDPEVVWASCTFVEIEATDAVAAAATVAELL